jgi:transcriptional regulator with XRE-family HTH domain
VRNKTNNLGQNIRNLRKAHGETQLDLALSLGGDGKASSTISMYENGTREPDLETMQEIAKHYNITLDRLVRTDFSKCNFMSTTYNWDNIISMFEIMFPLVYSEDALKNPYFKKGYIRTDKILQEIKKGGNVSRSEFETALDDYSKSLEEAEIIDAVANILWLIFLLYSLQPDERAIKIGEALLHNNIPRKEFIKNYALNNTEDSACSNEQKKAYARDLNTAVVSYIQTLKDSKEYTELGDYYLALRYIIGMIDNDYEQPSNKDIGMEMMLSYLSLGNLYAFRFIEKAISI